MLNKRFLLDWQRKWLKRRQNHYYKSIYLSVLVNNMLLCYSNFLYICVTGYWITATLTGTNCIEWNMKCLASIVTQVRIAFVRTAPVLQIIESSHDKNEQSTLWQLNLAVREQKQTVFSVRTKPSKKMSCKDESYPQMPFRERERCPLVSFIYSLGPTHDFNTAAVELKYCWTCMNCTSQTTTGAALSMID